MANTFVKLATGSGGALTIDFQSIPQVYKDLVIIGTLAHDLNFGYGTIPITFNNDSSAIYDYAVITGLWTRTVQYNTTQFAMEIVGTGSTSDELSPFVITIPNYASTTTHKPFLWRVGVTSGAQTFQRIFEGGGMWKSTSAVNRITFTGSSGTIFRSISQINLYGLAGS